MSDPIRHLSISQSPVFLINSRLGLFTAPHLSEGLFSRSYESILPSSLATDHSSALGYSPRLPVSVYGTGCLIRCFLEVASSHYHIIPEESVYYPTFTRGSTYYSVSTRYLHFSVTLILSRYRNINLFAIGFASRLHLRTRLTLF